jgi:hypothetical protein
MSGGLELLPVLPTLTDTFIWDLWITMGKDLELTGMSPHRVSEEDVMKTLDFYRRVNWTKVRGLRPWTHWNFVRCLDDAQRAALAKEVVKYMAENGVKGSDK